MPKTLDITGLVYGKLTAKRRVGANAHRHSVWLFRCECGNDHEATLTNIRAGKVKSCGCEWNRTHGMRNTPEYTAYRNMIARCASDNIYYTHAVVCTSWIESFQSFFDDMGFRPNSTSSIDRIDGKKGYCKSNCRWTTKTVQSVNRGDNRNNKSGHKGVIFDKERSKWRAYINVNKKQIDLGRFKYKKDAILAREQGYKKYHRGILENDKNI
ncbi:MAG: hypothetical protein P8I94_06165 [Emcibacteraceae bacterium]|nr:hypothetical protein [Emcibacteraceae bacterium]